MSSSQPPPRSHHPKHDYHISQGKLYQQWLNGPQGNAPTPCPVQRSTLQYNQLTPVVPPSSSLLQAYESMPDTVRLAQSAGILRRDNTFHKIYTSASRPGIEPQNIWAGLVAPGHIFIEYFGREDKSGPYISEMTSAIYQHFYPLEYLRTVCLMNVRNEDTRGVLERELLRSSDRKSCVFQYDSEGYQRVLGTELGKVVACFLLGAFAPGTRRISEIGILGDGTDGGVIHLRFEIWPIAWPVTGGE